MAIIVYQYRAARARGGDHSPDPAAAHPRTGARNASPAEDASARDRIIQAAIELYGEHGFTGASLKQIGQRAKVSAPLVIHHFGSKAGLREACDQHAADTIYRTKCQGVSQGRSMSPQYMLAASQETRPVLSYIIQSLMTGGQAIDSLMDRLVDDAVDYTTDAVQKGLVRPSRDERRREALMLLQGLGSMMLHRQMKRLIGTSPMDDPPEAWGPYLATVMEIYTGGVFEPGAYDHLTAAPHHVSERWKLQG